MAKLWDKEGYIIQEELNPSSHYQHLTNFQIYNFTCIILKYNCWHSLCCRVNNLSSWHMYIFLFPEWVDEWWVFLITSSWLLFTVWPYTLSAGRAAAKTVQVLMPYHQTAIIFWFCLSPFSATVVSIVSKRMFGRTAVAELVGSVDNKLLCRERRSLKIDAAWSNVRITGWVGLTRSWISK